MKFKLNCATKIIGQMVKTGQVSCSVDDFCEQFRILTAPGPGSANINPRWGLEKLNQGGFTREYNGRVILTDRILKNPAWEQDFNSAQAPTQTKTVVEFNPLAFQNFLK